MTTLIVALSQAPAVGRTLGSDLSAVDGTASALRGIAATIFVLGLLGAVAWMLRRGTITLPGHRTASAIRVETAVSLGERRSLVVVSVEGRRLLLGLTPMQVSVVTELSATAPAFAQSLEKKLTVEARQ